MTIEVTLKASPTTSHESVDLEDLGYTEEEWRELDGEEQEQAIRDHILNDDHERPFWTISKIDTPDPEEAD